jgi:hypothetical protein
MPTRQNARAPAQRRPSLTTGAEGRDSGATAWTAPGLAAACGHMLYKGRVSELVPRDVCSAGRRRAHRRPGGSYGTTS